MAKQYGKVSAVDFASANLMSFGKSFSRLSGQPLDKSEVWYDNFQALQDYALTDAAYVGQKVVFVNTAENTVTHYSIELSGELKELGSIIVGDEDTIVVSEDGTISLAGISTLEFERTDGEGNVTKISYQPLLIDGKLTWVEPNATTIDDLSAEIERLRNRITLIENDFLTSTDKAEIENKITAEAEQAKEDAIIAIMGEAGVDEKYDTLKEIADWILSDTTSSAELITRVSTIENNYLNGTDKTDIESQINSLNDLIGNFPENSISDTVVEYIQEVVDNLKIGDYAKASELTNLANRISTLETKVSDLENIEAEKNIINSVDDTQFSIDDNRKLTLLDIAMSKVTGLEDALNAKASSATTLSGYGIVDAYTKEETLTKIEEKITEVNGGESAGEVLSKLNSYIETNDNTVDSIKKKLDTVESNAQVNLIESIKINDVGLDIVDKTVNIPIATTNLLGVVMSSTDENKISIGADGTMEINSVNINKLTQTDGDILVLNGGSSSI